MVEHTAQQKKRPNLHFQVRKRTLMERKTCAGGLVQQGVINKPSAKEEQVSHIIHPPPTRLSSRPFLEGNTTYWQAALKAVTHRTHDEWTAGKSKMFGIKTFHADRDANLQQKQQRTNLRHGFDRTLRREEKLTHPPVMNTLISKKKKKGEFHLLVE